MSNDYQGPERRSASGRAATLDEISRVLNNHAHRTAEQLGKIKEDMLKAFPDGDLEGHCSYHEQKIKAARAEEAFWQTARSEAIKHGVAGLMAVLKWVSILAIVGGAYKVGLGPAAAKLFGVGQ